MNRPKRTFMNHHAESSVWNDFLAALTQKYGKFWLICNHCIKKLVVAQVPEERRRKNEYQVIIAFKAAYLTKIKHGEIKDPVIKLKNPAGFRLFFPKRS